MGLRRRCRREAERPQVESPGLWCGQLYKADGSAESAEHFRDMRDRGGKVLREAGPGGEGVLAEWVCWPFWQERWQVGDVLDGHLGVLGFDPTARPHAHMEADWSRTQSGAAGASGG